MLFKYLKISLMALSLMTSAAYAEEVVVSTYPGSCLVLEMCIETSSDFTVVQAQNNCSKIKGTYSANHCPRANWSGSCQEKTKSDKAYSAFYYNITSINDQEELKMDCSFRAGKWVEASSSVALNE